MDRFLVDIVVDTLEFQEVEDDFIFAIFINDRILKLLKSEKGIKLRKIIKNFSTAFICMMPSSLIDNVLSNTTIVMFF